MAASGPPGGPPLHQGYRTLRFPQPAIRPHVTSGRSCPACRFLPVSDDFCQFLTVAECAGWSSLFGCQRPRPAGPAFRSIAQRRRTALRLLCVKVTTSPPEINKKPEKILPAPMGINHALGGGSRIRFTPESLKRPVPALQAGNAHNAAFPPPRPGLDCLMPSAAAARRPAYRILEGGEET